MISKEEEKVLAVALASEKVASEIVVRVIGAVPANAAAAQAILDIIDTSDKEEKQLEEYLVVALASKEVGASIADKLSLIQECLQFQAADDVGNNVALNAAQAILSPLSEKEKEYLTVCLANKQIAESIAAKIDLAIDSAANIPDAV